MTLTPQTRLFVFNFSTDSIHGPFFMAPNTQPALNIVPTAFKGKFPAQLRIVASHLPWQACVPRSLVPWWGNGRRGGSFLSESEADNLEVCVS